MTQWPRRRTVFLQALEAVANAQQALNTKVNAHDKIIVSHGQDIAHLEKGIAASK